MCREFRERYRCFVVDGYQDVTPVQQGLLDEWLGARDDLTVVGDANQTIYSFTGATPSYLLDFTRRFGDATLVTSNVTIVRRRNRRAGQPGDRAGARPDRRYPAAAARAASAVPHPCSPNARTGRPKAVAIATKVAALIQAGVPASEIAILYRISARSESRAGADRGRNPVPGTGW